MGNGDVDVVVAAVARSLRAALVAEAGFADADAEVLARECGLEVRKLFLAPGPLRGVLAYAATPAGLHAKPDWMRINPDSLVADIDAALGAGNWVVLDAVCHLEAACAKLVAGDPQFAVWKAHQVAAGN